MSGDRLSPPDVDVCVVGRSLAAWVACRRLERTGLDLRWVRPPSGSLASLWGGLGQVFGPSQPLLPDSAGALEGRLDQPISFDPAVELRWRRLSDRRTTTHPYSRLGLPREQVSKHISRALDLLDDLELARADDSSAVPGPHGAPYAVDIAAQSVRRRPFDPGTRLCVVGAGTLDSFRAEPTARRLDRAAQLDAEVWNGPPFDELGDGTSHPVRAARSLWRAFESAGDSLFASLAEHCRQRSIDVVLLPPCIGATFPTHRAIMEGLREVLPCEVAEMPAERDSIHGWRIDRALRDEDSNTTIRRELQNLSVTDEGVELTAESAEPFRAAACLLATGGFFDGGLPAEAPVREELTGAPLWIDGAPVDNTDEVFVPRLLDERPWNDHRLFRAGLAVDSDSRVLDRDGSPKSAALFAAGRLLSGFNPIHDGCSMGVELASGLAAADSLAAILPRTDDTSEGER